MIKKCTVCLEKKSLDSFGPGGRPDGSLHTQCNDCRNRQSREYVARIKKQNEEGYVSPVALQSFGPKEVISNFDEFDGIF